jgi:hypothetical protein
MYPYFNKLITEINEKDLQSLVDNKVEESKIFEFKELLFNDSRDDRKEFLSDVSSFANASGGYLIFGVKEKEGIAKEICGLKDINPDEEKLKIENIIRNGIEPRIPSLSVITLKLSNSNYIILLYIAKSWINPHVVNYAKHWRFYTRNSAGKYPLDVGEVRTAIIQSDTAVDRVRNFQSKRLGDIIAGETPVELHSESKAKLIFHIIPFNAFDSSSSYDMNYLYNDPSKIKPMSAGSWDTRLNFDGIVSYTGNSGKSGKSSYLQIYRNGIIEAVTSRITSEQQNGMQSIQMNSVIGNLKACIEQTFHFYKKLGVSPPFFIMLALLGVKGLELYAEGITIWADAGKIDRENLILPEMLIEDYEGNLDDIISELLVPIWHAGDIPTKK